jgi:hypothetical protein
MPLYLNHHVMKTNGWGIAPRILGRATAQAVSRRPFIRRHGFSSRAFYTGFVRGKGTLGNVFSQSTSVVKSVSKRGKSDCLLRYFCLSACLCLSVCPYGTTLGSDWTDFDEIWYLSIFWMYRVIKKSLCTWWLQCKTRKNILIPSKKSGQAALRGGI